MIRENTRRILEKIDGERAYQTVAEISTFHRIQASTGFRAAAEHCAAKLRRWGVENAEVLSYPATEKDIFGTYPSFQEWDCKGAYCDLVTAEGEERLADFDACAISVIQKSAPCDHTKKPVEVVMLEKEDESYIKKLDIKGKIVFTRGDINKVYHAAVEEMGAVGLITDFVLTDKYVRERHDQSDTRRYTSFWWKPGQKKAFGFVLTPRQGDKLAAYCAEMKAKKQPVLVKCRVDSSIYDGHIENVTAFLPGQTDEEILLVGHLCHPRSSSNDNASGSACVMEAFKTIRDMVARGELAPLKRGLRMLLVPEFTGTYAYLSSLKAKEKDRIKAAFNLDMVGGRQSGGYGPITITDLPLETPSIVSDAAGTILDEIKHQVSGMMKDAYCPMFNSHMTEYSGGSDHVVLSDPATNIPCLMLGQWPDKFYHTSSDTLEVVDPYILSRSASLAACYAYCLANIEPADIGEICNTGLARAAVYMSELQNKVTRGLLDKRFYHGRLAKYTGWRLASIDDFKNWVDCDKDELEAEKARLIALVKAFAGFNPMTRPVKSLITKVQREKYNLVAERKVSVPVMLGKLDGMYDKKTNEMSALFLSKYGPVLGHAIPSAIDYMIDGKKTTAEIAAEVAYEFGVYCPDGVDLYVRTIIAMGFAKAKK